MDDTRKDIFKKIHERCFQLGSCNYKETGCSDCPINVTLVKAETLLDKQEQGLLIELPVPIGTTVYITEDDCVGDVCGCVGDCGNCASHRKYVDEIEFDYWLIHAWGKCVFATEAEAEEALAKGGK